MDKDKQIKPAEIHDDQLDVVQGGIRVMSPSIRVPSSQTKTLTEPVLDPKTGLAEYDESGPGIVHRNLTMKRGRP